jgi:hypothetical protein
LYDDVHRYVPAVVQVAYVEHFRLRGSHGFESHTMPRKRDHVVRKKVQDYKIVVTAGHLVESCNALDNQVVFNEWEDWIVALVFLPCGFI